MKAVFQAIQEKVKTLAKIKTVDLYNQKFFTAEGQSLITPAILIEFGNTTWTRNKSGIQQGSMNIRIHIVDELYEDFFEGSQTQTRALEVFDLVDEVYLNLQDLSSDKFTPFERTQTETPSEFDNVIIHVLNFKTIYTDVSKSEDSKYIKIEPDIEPKRVGIDTI